MARWDSCSGKSAARGGMQESLQRQALDGVYEDSELNDIEVSSIIPLDFLPLQVLIPEDPSGLSTSEGRAVIQEVAAWIDSNLEGVGKELGGSSTGCLSPHPFTVGQQGYKKGQGKVFCKSGVMAGVLGGGFCKLFSRKKTMSAEK
ncbi:hypothetical protein F0562_032375 [Nyssa sinensis]|uniref:Uncharacterized protein n=1 Tax=Nyssa sinensis TaxID=561372 RepID=A0A5J5ANX3_9ASTE|nr:hypothetical protein F0562_032375 [Nyssa sinensis]